MMIVDAMKKNTGRYSEIIENSGRQSVRRRVPLLLKILVIAQFVCRMSRLSRGTLGLEIIIVVQIAAASLESEP